MASNTKSKAKAKRRKSEVVKYCSQHGVFQGFAWNGHRKHCQAREVTEQEWEEIKAKDAPENAPKPEPALKVNGMKELDPVRAGLKKSIKSLVGKRAILLLKKKKVIEEIEKELVPIEKTLEHLKEMQSNLK
jgi:hypothetical protein